MGCSVSLRFGSGTAGFAVKTDSVKTIIVAETRRTGCWLMLRKGSTTVAVR
jgi:hypothetical protein